MKGRCSRKLIMGYVTRRELVNKRQEGEGEGREGHNEMRVEMEVRG